VRPEREATGDGDRIDSRYYNGVPSTRTTISCVLAAIFVGLYSIARGPTPASLASLALRAQSAQSPSLTFPLESQWAATLGAAPAFAPAYDSTRAFVPLRNGRLVAVSLADGREMWSIDLTVTARPAAGEELVFASVDGAVEADAQSDGKTRWRTPIDARITAPLHWDAGWLIGSSERGDLLVFRAGDGKLLWHRELGSAVSALPALAGQRLYVGLEDGRLVALQLQTGNPVWSKQMREAPTGILALEDRLFLGSQDNFFYCISAEDGDTHWTSRTGADIVGSPVIDQRSVYFVSLDNILRALDRGNGSLRWRRQLMFRPSTGPLLSGVTVVVAGVAAELRAYSTLTGSPVGELVLKSEQGDELQLAAPPTLLEGIAAPLIILTRDGRMEGLGPAPPSAPPPTGDKPQPPPEKPPPAADTP